MRATGAMEAHMRELLPSIVGHVPGANGPTCCAGRARACGGDRGDTASPWIRRGEWRARGPAEGGARLSVTLLHAAGSTVALALEDYKPFADEDSGGGEGKAMAWVRKLAEMARSKDRASRLQVDAHGGGGGAALCVHALAMDAVRARGAGEAIQRASMPLRVRACECVSEREHECMRVRARACAGVCVSAASM